MKLKLAVLSSCLLALVAACSSTPTVTPAPGSAPNTGTGTSGHASPAATTSATIGGPAVFTPLTATVLAPPIPAPTTDGKIHLAYELQVENVISSPVTITSVKVQSGSDALLELPSAELPGWTKVFGSTTPGTTFGPGQGGLIWLDVILDGSATIPETLEHAIAITVEQPNLPIVPAELTEMVAVTDVVQEEPILIAPPLKGANWLDGNSCCTITPHRAAVSPLDGQLWAPERWAIDYVQLTADNKVYNGDKTKLESYPYYGDDVIAVGPGKVVAVVDDLPEQTPGANPTGLRLDEYGGNHVVQDLGNGHYAFYAHLQTGGVKVKVGDELATGQVVGLLGNTGNTDSPHLHFHIMDGPDPLASNGLPFRFTSFTLTGRMTGDDAVDALISKGSPAELVPGVTATKETDLTPLYLDLMSYP